MRSDIVARLSRSKVGEAGSLSPAAWLEQWLFNDAYYDAERRRRRARPGPSTFLHWREIGQYENLSPSPFLNVTWCRLALSAGEDDIVGLWSQHGWRTPLSPIFDPIYYVMRNPDVLQTKIDPYIHWLTYGLFEGRQPGPHVALHTFPGMGSPAPERRQKLREITDLASFLTSYGRHSSVDVEALQEAFPEVEDLWTALATGDIPFCVDPQTLFGSCSKALLTDPLCLRERP